LQILYVKSKEKVWDGIDGHRKEREEKDIEEQNEEDKPFDRY